MSHYIGLGRVDDVYDIMGMIKEEIDNFYSVEDLEECLELVCSILKKDSYNFEIYVGSCFLELCRYVEFLILENSRNSHVLERVLSFGTTPKIEKHADRNFTSIFSATDSWKNCL